MTGGHVTADGELAALRELCEAHLRLCEAARGRLLPGDGAAYMQAEDACRDRLGDVVFADPWSAPAELARLRAGEPPWGALLAAAGDPEQQDDSEDDDEPGEDDADEDEPDLGPWRDELGELAALARELGTAGTAVELVAGLDASQKAGLLLALGGGKANFPRTADEQGAHPAGGWGIPPDRVRWPAEQQGGDFPSINYRNEPASIRSGIATGEISRASRPPRSKSLRKYQAARGQRAKRRAALHAKWKTAYGRRAA